MGGRDVALFFAARRQKCGASFVTSRLAAPGFPL